jgi:EAL domain-containing protein (putative c-di-GMP-specific phosphodiesterase class I)
MVVIDMFSSINGLYGMQTGEEILRIFGENLQRLVGDAGQVYHLQGAVFCICMEDMNQEATLQLYHEIQQMGYHRISFGDLEVTLRTLGSATIFGFAPNEAERISSNLSHVIGESRELYHSGLVFFDLVDHEHEMNDRDVLGEIYQDIMQGCQDFRLYYQPIVAANSGEIVGAEALIRWQREPYGLVAPNRFIPYMEQNPCIYEMGNWVLQQALKDAMQMSERLPGFIINVNVAPTQLERKEFAPGVIRMLEETGYPPENLCLELTERCRELDFEFLRQQIEFFRSHGIRVAMDDFGTGHAALQLVLELPIDEIKIDRNFVQDIQQQKINQVIVSGIAKEAHTLNAEICIEGIEDEELGNYLQQFGPTYYQGYYYSKPVAKEDFLALLA